MRRMKKRQMAVGYLMHRCVQDQAALRGLRVYAGCPICFCRVHVSFFLQLLLELVC